MSIWDDYLLVLCLTFDVRRVPLRCQAHTSDHHRQNRQADLQQTQDFHLHDQQYPIFSVHFFNNDNDQKCEQN